MEGADLLRLLDAWVRSDGARPGFRGTFCLGARDERGGLFWHVELGDRKATTRFDRQPNLQADALLFLRRGEARSLLGDDAGAGSARVQGDGGLFRRFVRRYIEQRNSIGIRCAAS